MKTATVPSTWLIRDGRRLDSGPYTSGGLQAKMLLEELSLPKQPLRTLTHGHDGGIYNGPMFRRRWVNDPRYGVPFLGSSAMLMADLSNLPLLRKRDAQSPRLSYLRLSPGMTLISCSGTIGRMVYVRPDMEGIWSSQHIMKIAADPSKVPPGYLYGFLSSKFGVPIVTSSTYGAIIQHIEPHHITALGIPRFGDEVEQQTHKLVQGAAEKRTHASVQLAAAVRQLEETVGLPAMVRVGSSTPHSVVSTASSKVQHRLDAFFHSRYQRDVVEQLEKCDSPLRTVGEIAQDIVEPLRFKRIPIKKSSYGVPFFGTTGIMWSEPRPIYHLPKRQSRIKQYIVSRRTLLIPRSGQLSGIIGTAVFPHGAVVGGAVTEDAIRILCADQETAGFLFVALTSAYGIRQLKARAYGSSIPHLDVRQIGAVFVPDPGPARRSEFGRIGATVGRLRDEAIQLENEARALVEGAIEQAA